MKGSKAEYDLIEGHFPAIYLTIIALVQGIALSELVKSALDCAMLDRFYIAFAVVFLVWHHYMYGVIYLRWFPGMLDTFLPLLLGVTQFLSISAVKEDNPFKWLFFLSLFFFSGALAYLNAAVRAKSMLFYHYGNEISIKYSKLIFRCHVSASAICLLQFFLICLIAFNIVNYVWIYLVAVLLIVHITGYEIYYLRKIKPHYILMLESRSM
jgi:hypothetical protein